MSFTNENSLGIKILRKEKSNSSRKLICELPNKHWNRRGLEFRPTDQEDRQCAKVGKWQTSRLQHRR